MDHLSGNASQGRWLTSFWRPRRVQGITRYFRGRRSGGQTLMRDIPPWGREIQREILTKEELFGLSGSGDGTTVRNNPLMNSITHGVHNPVSVQDISDCTGHIEVRNTNNYNFISDIIKSMMDELDPSKELFDLINFDGSKVVHAAVRYLR